MQLDKLAKMDGIRNLMVMLYENEESTPDLAYRKIVKEISVGELIDMISTFAVGDIIKELREKLPK